MELAIAIDKLIPIQISRLLVYGLVFTIVWGLIFVFYDRISQFLKAKYSEEEETIITRSYQLFMEYKRESVRKFLIAGTAVCFLLSFILVYPYLFLGIPLGMVMTIIFFMVPLALLRKIRSTRISKFTYQLIDALTLMSNALRSGLNIPQAIQLVADEMPNPVAQEFGLVLREQKVGVSLEDAIGHIADRLPSPDVEMFTTSVNILRETGGNLAETFDSITHTIRERNKLEQKISAMVAQGVVQGVIMVLLPFGLAIVMYMINPQQVGLMFTTPVGWILLGVMMFLQCLGGLAIWKIINVKV